MFRIQKLEKNVQDVEKDDLDDFFFAVIQDFWGTVSRTTPIWEIHQPLGDTLTCPPFAALATKKTFCSRSHAMCCSERHSKILPMATMLNP